MPLLSFADLPARQALATPAPVRRQRRPALRELLDQSLALPPETRNELSSHMPMALHALSELGASDARLHAFYAHYLRRFEGAPPAQAWAPAPVDWPVRLGDFSAFAGLRTAFTEALAEQGRDAVLKAVLPRLWPGVAAAAFHGPIRVAHAVEAAHEGELAAALAYWAARWQPLSPPEPAPLHLPLRDWSRQLAESAADWRSSAPLISLRMDAASATPTYRRLAGALAPAGSLTARWQQLVTLALNTYADSGNFTVLHMVTGLRAVHVLSPWLAGAASGRPQGRAMPSPPPEGVKETWDGPALPCDEAVLDHAFTAAWMAARLPAMDPLSSRSVPRPAAEWPALVAAAIASDDHHVIKLVHACVRLSPLVGDDRLCREAATRATRAAGPGFNCRSTPHQQLHLAVVQEAGLAEQRQVHRVGQAHVVQVRARPAGGFVVAADLRQANDDGLARLRKGLQRAHLLVQWRMLARLVQQLQVVDHHQRAGWRVGQARGDVPGRNPLGQVEHEARAEVGQVMAQLAEAAGHVCRGEFHGEQRRVLPLLHGLYRQADGQQRLALAGAGADQHQVARLQLREQRGTGRLGLPARRQVAPGLETFARRDAVQRGMQADVFLARQGLGLLLQDVDGG